MLINVAICDDEEIVRKEIRAYVSEYLEKKDLNFSVEEFADGSQLIEAHDIDILFLDVEMEEMNGITVKDKLCESGDDVQIVFVTSHEECMPEAFGKNVCGFIKKPICEEFLRNKLDDIICYLSKRKRCIVIEGNGGMHSVPISDITYIESVEKYSRIHTVSGEKFFSNTSLGGWDKELAGEDFYRCHRKYLVGLWNIGKITERVIFVNGDEVDVSRRNREGLKQSYRHFILRNAR